MNALAGNRRRGAVGFIAALLAGWCVPVVVNVSGLAGFITRGHRRAHYRFRRAYLEAGPQPREPPYGAVLPRGPIIGLLMCLVGLAARNYEAIISGDWACSAPTLVCPSWRLCVVGHRIVTRDRLIRWEEMDGAALGGRNPSRSAHRSSTR